MPLRHCIWAVLVLAALELALPRIDAAAQQPPASTTRGYTVFVRGSVVGREDVTVRTGADGTTITGKGRLSGVPQIVIRRAEVRYRAGWIPEAYVVEASVNGGDTNFETVFSGGTAVTKGIDAGQPIAHTEPVPERLVVLSNVFFGSFEALTRQLATAASDQQFAAFVSTGAQASIRLVRSGAERVQVGTSILAARRYEISLVRPEGMTPIDIYADADGSLLRIHIPEGSIDVVRDDLAAATSRTVVYSNPTDEAVIIPSAGFNLGATITATQAVGARHPAIILLGDAAANERDGIVGGVPILGQLAGALADAGFLAVRYDKRGYGQSGGRAESATLADHAEDTLAVVRWLRNRPDVDGNRIAILGHNEGAWTALLAASRERRVAAVIAVAAPSTTGAERVLEQQRQVLEQLHLPPAERTAKIELQTRINAAATTGRGWEGIPADMRKQADTPWFQSFLRFDPARVIEDVRQPLLIVHGALDAEVPASHADRLAEIAKKGRSRSVSVVTVRGVNHLLTPAVTGGVVEYTSLKERAVSKDVLNAVSEWLTNTLAAIR